MARPSLKLVQMDSQESSTSHTSQEPTLVPVSVRDLVPLLVDAYRSDRTWLNDFSSDSILIPPDLYEVLLAYRQYRRAEAA